MDDSDKECAQHARQLCKEALQEGAFSAKDLQTLSSSMSPASRDYVKEITRGEDRFLSSPLISSASPPVSTVSPISGGMGVSRGLRGSRTAGMDEMGSKSMAEPASSLSNPPNSNGIPPVFPLEVDESDLFLPSDSVASLSPLQSIHFDGDPSLFSVVEPILTLLRLLEQFENDSILSDWFDEELRDVLKAFHQLVLLFDAVDSPLFLEFQKNPEFSSLLSSFDGILSLLLRILEQELRRIEQSEPSNDALFSSLIQLLLFFFYSTEDHPGILQCTAVSQLALSQLLDLLILAVKVDSQPERSQRYQQLLSWFLAFWRRCKE